jgi:hypothetical protein
MSSTTGDIKQAKADNDPANVDVAALVASYLPKYEFAVKLEAKEAAENILQLKVAGLIDAPIAEATEDARITDAAMATNVYNTVKPRLDRPPTNTFCHARDCRGRIRRSGRKVQLKVLSKPSKKTLKKWPKKLSKRLSATALFIHTFMMPLPIDE